MINDTRQKNKEIHDNSCNNTPWESKRAMQFHNKRNV